MNTTSETRGVRLRTLWLTLCFLAITALGALAFAMPLFLTGSILLVCAVGVFTVFRATARPEFYIPVGIAALAILYLLGGGLFPLLLGVLALIMAFVLFAAIGKKSTKSGTTVALTITLILGALLIAAVLYGMAGNAFTPKEIGKTIDNLFNFPKNVMTELVLRYFENLTEADIKILTQNGIELETLRESSLAAVTAIVESLRALAPGLLIAAAQILSYIAVCVFVLTAKCAKLYALLPEPKWVLYPTQITCILFMATLFVYMIVSFLPSGAVALVIANLMLMLLPSMTACGIRGIAVRMRHPLLRRRMTVFLIVFLVLTVFTLGVALPFTAIILALLGAKDVSTLRAVEASLRNKNKNE